MKSRPWAASGAGGPWRAASVLTSVALVMAMALHSTTATGVCQHNGFFFPNGSVWRGERCEECACQGWVSSCEKELCLDPVCPPESTLVQDPRLCCPQCQPPAATCTAGDQVYQHAEIWNVSSSCEQCRCVNGTVSCGRTLCHSTQCPEGQVSLQMPEECCPKCVPTGRSCRSEDAVHIDGELWSPVACMQCQCMDGRTQCFVAQCPHLMCPTNHSLILKSGACCPTCQGNDCSIPEGQTYKSGTQWRVSPCEECVCLAGRVECHKKTCPKLECSDEEEATQMKDTCCPTCTKKEGWCNLTNSESVPHGRLWTTSSCEACSCHDGSESCSPLTCDSSIECGPGEERITADGQCCPQCRTNTKLCYADGGVRQSGKTWPVGCSVCSCNSGSITCYTPECPTCPVGSVSAPASAEECCPSCVPLTCPGPDCLTCHPGGSAGPICIACQGDLLLQGGICVSSCAEGYYNRGRHCLQCHHTCGACTHETKFHCIRCAEGLLVSGGQCLEDCGRGYFPNEGACQQCHESCQECSGPTAADCQVCSHNTFLLGDACVPHCPQGYYNRGGICEACEDDCEKCGVRECLQCSEGFWRQEGKCYSECQTGFYKSINSTCEACHDTCDSCKGPGVSSCNSCPHYLLQHGSTCVTVCPRGTYEDDSHCKSCHSTCSECLGQGENNCVECSAEDNVLVPGDGITGKCTPTCPETYKQLEHICVAPPSACSSWHIADPTSCHECDKGWLLQEGLCVETCTKDFFKLDNKPICLPCNPRCTECSGPGHHNCVSCPKGATLRKKENGGECLTKCKHRHYLAENMACLTCHKSCDACTIDPINSSRSICLHCKAGHQLPEGNHCVAECTDGHYFHQDLAQCLPCNPLCATCNGSGSNSCTSCSEGAKLSDEGVCEAIICARGSYLSSNGSCISCEGDCHYCSQDGSICINCGPGRHVLYGKCVSKCPTMFFSEASSDGECQECHWTCKDCLGPSEADCLECSSNMLREGNKCVAQCSAGYFQDHSTCIPCSGGCQECSTLGCSMCRPPYFLQEGSCNTSCNPGSFANVFDNICFECGESCLECSKYECLKCKPSLLLQDGQCASACKENFYADKESGICYYNIYDPILTIVGPIMAALGSPFPLNGSAIHVLDPDTPLDRLSLIFLETPSNGIVYKVDNGRNKEINKGEVVSLKEMKEGRVFFQHSPKKSFFNQMKLEAFDGQLYSGDDIVTISIVSQHPTKVIVNTPLIIKKGETRIISSKELLLYDEDNMEDVIIKIITETENGNWAINGKTKNVFSISDLIEGKVAYTHTSSSNVTLETTLFQATDGHNIINFAFRIYIVDDEKSVPVLIKNQGTHVVSGKKVQLTPGVLQASDVDSDDKNLVFTLLPVIQNLGQGSVVLVIPLPPAPEGFFNDGWTQMDDSHLLRPATSFTQRDINEGNVWYVHSGHSDNEITSDQMLFSVADNANPPNILSDQAFVIQVEPSNDVFEMSQSTDVQLGITLMAGQAVTIDPSHLSFSGMKSADHLVYTITHALTYDQGSLFHIDSPGLELRQFTQADINDMKIIYMPPFGDMGEEEKHFSFKFTISDEMTGESNRLPEQKFNIRVIPVIGKYLSFLNQDPQLMTSSHGSVVLDAELFELSSPEENEEAVFILLEPPLHGSIIQNLRNNSLSFTEEDSFDMAELSNSELKYQHDGSSSSFDSFVFLALGDAAEATTRFDITINQHDKQEPAKSQNSTFSMTMHEGETRSITIKELHFTDIHSNDDDLVYTLADQPKYGTLYITEHIGIVRILNETHKFSQADITYGMLNYSSNVETGLNTVTETLMFNVTDVNNNALTNQVLLIEIKPVDNRAPKVELGPTIEVDEGGSLVIPPDAIHARDEDSYTTDLRIIIDAHPIFGYITNTLADLNTIKGSSGSSQIAEFALSDMIGGRVTYVQSQHRHQEPDMDSLLFHITDGINISPIYTLNITIKPMNDESPVLLGEQVVVGKGQTVVIRNHSLFISDADSQPDEMKISIQQLPQHGSIHRKFSREGSIKKSEQLGRDQPFTLKDLHDELILYSHDGSRDPEDVMEITVNDGNHETGGIIEFVIVNNEEVAPRLMLSSGLTLKAGEVSIISPSTLMAEDKDSEPEMIKYILTRLPASGRLELYRPRLQKWNTLTVDSIFMQKDILKGNIRFVHEGTSSMASDSLMFNLEDSEGNVMMDQALSITVLEDLIPPRITINNGLTLREDASSAITASDLSATDDETDPLKLKYTLLSGPHDGRLELSTAPGKAISSWTQQALEVGILRYQNLPMNETHKDQFVFYVSDGKNNASQTFSINITPVDDELPLLVLNSVKVQEGHRKILSQFEVEALDADTPDSLIVFTVHKPPRRGKLQIQQNDGYIDTKSFSMLDVYNGNVSYLHGGSDSSRDSFKISVSDSTNNKYLREHSDDSTIEPSTVHVEISAVDDGTPILVANRGLQYLRQENGKAKNSITRYELSVEDEDTDSSKIQYKVSVPPKQGVLRLRSKESPTSMFTQADINDGNLYYELTTYTQTTTQDEFTFEISDSKPNVVSDNVFHIQWIWIMMERKEYNVTETEGKVKVLIKRIGNLKQHSTVNCVSHAGSATDSGNEKDFTPVSELIKFHEGQTENYCEISIHDDNLNEGPEVFNVKLSSPNYALIGKPKKTVLRILDEEDIPTISFETKHFSINESDGTVFARLKRDGDSSIPASVMCLTEDATAKGVSPEDSERKYEADYIQRIEDETSRVVFPPGVTVASCNVKIFDDNKFEFSEDFKLYLKNPSLGVKLGEIINATIDIKGPNDLSSISLSRVDYSVSESDGLVTLSLERSGVDLMHTSSVWCATKSLSNEEAQASLDYIPHTEEIVFKEGVKKASCTINIVDDKANPRLEGRERFIVFLSTAKNASISDKSSEATVTIHDEDDAPSMQFIIPDIKVRENQTIVKIPIQRSGDLSKISTVYCFTRQRSAKAGIDFMERPNTEDSIVSFPKGVSRIECEIGLLDDLIYEKEEEFIVKLSTPESPSNVRPVLGGNKIIRVTILDWEDRPRISLGNSVYTITEPQIGEFTKSLKIPIVRMGDTSRVSQVRVSTRDGSATANNDFRQVNTSIEFLPGETMTEIELEIMRNKGREWHETFALILGPDDPINAELGAITSAAITIYDSESAGSSVLPAPPLVTSLLYYNNIEEHLGEPATAGYPLICVTPCDAKYPESDKTREMCTESDINVTTIKYSWEVAIPGYGDDILTPFHSLNDDTLFASPHGKVLDSMFFARHFRVRCVAQPVIDNGELGVPLRSKPITIGINNGICQTAIIPGQPGGYQGQSFLASLSYINASDSQHPNTIKINVEIPHQDGMIPLVSTLPLHNLRYLLTEQLYRAHHTCSNMDPLSGFLDESTDHHPLHPRPHQLDQKLRENKTLELYRHLDLNRCIWSFSAWFSMSELVDRCGGQVVSDFQVGSGGQSFLTVRVPLYISYVYASSPPGWASLDHRTELSVSLYYNTLLWHHGLQTKPNLTAKIQLTRISIDDSGKLVIDLKTRAKFRGQFVLRNPEVEKDTSSLIAPKDMDIKFALELLWTSSTWDGPEQVWRAISNYNLKDYSGEYILKLIPCTVTPEVTYKEVSPSSPPACVPQSPTSFPLPISIQQTHRPVPLVYTLNTDFQLLNSPELFLMDPQHVDNLQEVDYKGSYGPGQVIYGRVLWHPSQDLHSAYTLNIQRVFLCTGAAGHVPTYDPTGELYKEGQQYGCIQPSNNLKHRYLILDREQPWREGNKTNPFVEAYFAEDHPDFDSLRQFSGVDGFLMNTDALYEVNSGHQWFLQVLYTIGPSHQRGKRDLIELQSVMTDMRPLNKRKSGSFGPDESLPTPAFLQSLHVRNGTNMRGFQLYHDVHTASGSDRTVFLSVLYIIIALTLLLVIIIAILLLIKRHFKNNEKDKIIVVRSLKNEREEYRIKNIKNIDTNTTLNSESNLQTVKVKTLAITVRNNLDDEGTEV